ncbi:hypothetical protein L1987_16079 [Smallanthus sonchifolius]|uniref:Uncharacterized protein n=1 Tax=Smallanthus sonchifolius TaxID=185202 RepID=A0ACB9J9H7_9ASTR|nr:hypothetical protein L1987_16079 [Smallanthus sonchifolius]
MKLLPYGHLKVFEWQRRWIVVADLFNGYLGECNYPMACGRNGLCSGNQQCSCPVSSSSRIDYIRAVNDRQPNLFSEQLNEDMKRVDIETCKQACVNNCSSKASLAPEWLNVVITEKSGYMVDKYSEDTQTRGSEVVEMMKVASWCLQKDFTKMPMSMVVKVLEGVMKVESQLDYNFIDPRQQNSAVEHDQDMTPLMVSVLSAVKLPMIATNARPLSTEDRS